MLNRPNERGLDEASCLLSEFVWDLKISHDCVQVVKVILQLLLLLIQLRYEVRHLTEDVGIGNGREHHHYHYKQDFGGLHWSHLVKSENHECMIKGGNVLLQDVFLEDFGLCPDEINWRNPDWMILLKHYVPKNARNEVQTQTKEKDHLDDL